MADLKTQFLELTRMKYIDQAKWFLNGFWKAEAEQEAEPIWTFTQKFIELDTTKKKEGNELDEFQAHKFLESLGETLTVVALREKLRKIDLDCNGKMALLEYLCFKYQKSVKQIIDAPQGDNQKEVDEATEKLQAVQDALAEVQRQLDQQHRDLEAQKQAVAEQQRAVEQQKRAEEAVKKSEAELRAAVADLKSQEDAFHSQLQSLDQKSKDTTTGMVQRNKAAAELAQLKQENPLPLRKAKITQEAALRKVEKERKAAEEATLACEASAREAEKKKVALEEQKRRVEQAVRDTEARLQEAQDYLEEVKRKGGSAAGAIWWIERELKEAKKYLPKSKQ